MDEKEAQIKALVELEAEEKVMKLRGMLERAQVHLTMALDICVEEKLLDDYEADEEREFIDEIKELLKETE